MRKSFLLAAVLILICGVFGCKNNQKKTDVVSVNDNKPETVIDEPEIVEEIEEVVEEETPSYDVYSRGFDGFVNMRQKPSFSSPIVTEFKNGPLGAMILEDLGDWLKVDYDGQEGYVPIVYLQDSPTKEYTGNVDADWVSGVWEDGDEFLYVYNNGTFVHGESGIPDTYGLYVMQDNEVAFESVWFTDPYDDVLEIDEKEIGLGVFSKVQTNALYKKFRPNFNKVFEQWSDGVDKNLLEGLYSSASASSNNSIDEWLDSYEEYVQQAIRVLKKGQNGDAEAYAEYLGMQSKLGELAAKIENIKGEMTPAQMNRFNQIQLKIAQAAM